MRLLGALAEMGKAAVHEVAARVGMDPREAASRLVALSATGLPLLVGVECDPYRLRADVAARMSQAPQSAPFSGAMPAGPYQQQAPYQQQPYQGPQAPFPNNPGPPSGPHQVPSGPHHVPSGPHQVPSGPVPAQPHMPGPPSNPFPAQGPPSNPFPAPNQAPPQPPPVADVPVSTWGPPQTSTWARGDQLPQDLTQPTNRPPESNAREGKVGTTLQAEGLEGERLSVQLVEVVDPADYLFTAAGYRLQEGERSIVVHTEITNRGTVTFQTLPDLYLVLVTPEGRQISKAPVSLSSRPPHRIGVAPGETAGGHTVYVVPEDTEVVSVQWSPRPDEEDRTLTWSVTE
jgi:hypothetical protein